LKSLANGTTPAQWREVVYAENEISYMACTRAYKYVRYDSGANSEQLYDLIKDPHQTRNAASMAAM
jgi:hypothetical protein